VVVNRRRPREEVEGLILVAIRELSEEHGIPPNFRELGARVGLTHSAAHGYVARLRQAGLVHDPTTPQARSLVLTPAGLDAFHHLSPVETAKSV
jgi:DNA-binding MarR family transcriptional regulator